MEQTVIQKYSTSIVKGLIEKVKSLSELNHKLTKGELKELFVSDILKLFLTKQFGIGTGIVVNQKGEQSHQIDIIIYDNRILPPFIKEKHLGLFPAECVLCTIEIKSNLRKIDLRDAERKAENLIADIYNPESTIYKDDYIYFKPICAVLGFYGSGAIELLDAKKGKEWLKNNFVFLRYIGILNKYSWIAMVRTNWTLKLVDKYNNETKRFIPVLLDNIRTQAENRFAILSRRHNDWLGVYIRDQGLFS